MNLMQSSLLKKNLKWLIYYNFSKLNEIFINLLVDKYFTDKCLSIVNIFYL